MWWNREGGKGNIYGNALEMHREMHREMIERRFLLTGGK